MYLGQVRTARCGGCLARRRLRRGGLIHNRWRMSTNESDNSQWTLLPLVKKSHKSGFLFAMNASRNFLNGLLIRHTLLACQLSLFYLSFAGNQRQDQPPW